MEESNMILVLLHRELQENLIRSHAAGVGKGLSPEKTRMLLALRINVLAKGYSGIALGTLKQLIDAFNGKSGITIISGKLYFTKNRHVTLLCLVFWKLIYPKAWTKHKK